MALNILEQKELFYRTPLNEGLNISFLSLVIWVGSSFAASFYEGCTDIESNEPAASYQRKMKGACARFINQEKSAYKTVANAAVVCLASEGNQATIDGFATMEEWENFVSGKIKNAFEVAALITEDEKTAYGQL